MPAQVLSSIENNFTKGLVTEFTGLNFPENAATDTDNCNYTLVGDVVRRLGIDFEDNFTTGVANRTNVAMKSYEWNNVGGDGVTQLLVKQVGGTISFYSITAATILSPLSNQLLGSTVTLSTFVATGGVFDATKEAEFSSGNGYLFIYHPSCDPIYCTYDAGTVTGNLITIQIRDFTGILETGVADDYRPLTLTDSHKYNLLNQGWLSGSPWTATSTSSVTVGTGAKTFTIATGVTGVSAGQSVTVTGPPPTPGLLPRTMTGTVTSYTSGTGSLVLSITSTTGFGTFTTWTIVPVILGFVNTWFSTIGNYPSNSDVWWNFKNTSNVFDPATTQANTSAGFGPAPKGHNVLNAFTQQRTSVSSVPNLTDITTTVRPRTGCWFQGRVWYTGVDAQQPSTGTASYTTWTESIYFSQIVQSVADFGQCYQQNDPTSEDLFDLLPTDGGVIVIQGSGAVNKLFPIQNGMLVFAANGIWFITGSQGIGFSASDYTITKISSIKSIASTSYIDVEGLPYFWNEDSIYVVTPSDKGGLMVSSLTYSTIDSYYADIPLSSKKYARGDYDPINYTLKWIYKDTEASSTTDRYSFNKILNFNMKNKAFYPYSIPITNAAINGINFISGPGGSTCPPASFKFLCSYPNAGSYNVTFADEHDEDYVDWASTTEVDFESYFITGYKLHGQAQKRFQMPYIYVFSRNEEATQYKIQGLWDYAISGDSGKWSTAQIIRILSPNFGMVFRRHRIRGNGVVLQLKIKSVSGEPFDIMGWSSFETSNTGI